MTIVAVCCKRLLSLAIFAACAPAPAMPSTESPLARLEASLDLAGKPVGHAAGPTLVVVFASWCPHCRAELGEIATLREAHPTLRVIGVDYPVEETYADRGSARALREFATHVPWLAVVSADDDLFAAFGSPAHVPTTFAFESPDAAPHRLDGEVSRATLARALGYR